MMPQGIANIGLYHSHPKGVFHSHTDDKTLLDMGKIYPDIISVVTNGEDTYCYKIIDESVQEIPIETQKIQPTFSTLTINTNVNLQKQERYFNMASKFEKEIEKKANKNWANRIESGNSITLNLETINIGETFSLPITITCPILGNITEIPKKHITDTLKKTAYELLLSANSNLSKLQNSIVNYFGIPMIIYPNTFAKSSAKDRGNLIAKFDKETGKIWQKIAN